MLNNGQLTIVGTAGNDAIRASVSGSTIQASENGATASFTLSSVSSVVVRAGDGNDYANLAALPASVSAKLLGGTGSDTLIGSAANDQIDAGAGDDTIVCLGAESSITGGDGLDSYWVNARDTLTDVSRNETAASHVHSISGFYGNVSMAAWVQTTPEPDASNNPYSSVAAPLFTSTGPSRDDIRQGAIGDCYYLTALGGVAGHSADLIRQSVVDLGDGTYAVGFLRNNQPSYVRVDGQLPLGGTYYARADTCLWVGIMEKAYAEFRTGSNSYDSLAAGSPSDVWADLGFNSGWDNTGDFQTVAGLYDYIRSALNSGEAVGLDTYYGAGDVFVGSHSYLVTSAYTDGAGQHVVLRNPWGFNPGTANAYLTVSPSQIMANCGWVEWGVMSRN